MTQNRKHRSRNAIRTLVVFVQKMHTLWKHPTLFQYSLIRFLTWHLHQWWLRAILWKGPLKSFWPHDLDLWPMTLTYNPSTWPQCQKSSTHRKTDIQCQKYYTHYIRDVGCNKPALLLYQWMMYGRTIYFIYFICFPRFPLKLVLGWSMRLG